MLDDLFPRIDRHFLAPEMLARVAAFPRAGRDVEGWFKGELAYLFDSLTGAGGLADWRANVPIVEGRPQRCDFRLASSGGGVLWLEVRAVPQRRPSAGALDPGVFMQKGGAADVTEDLVKLMRVPDGETAVVLFVYPRPQPADWAEQMSTFSRRIAPISFKEESRLEDYPEALYICRLRLAGGF
jgi:hypothetical protein